MKTGDPRIARGVLFAVTFWGAMALLLAAIALLAQ